MVSGFDMRAVRDRLVMSALGGGAGMALWALGQSWDRGLLPPLLYLAIFAFVAVYAVTALALAGPVDPGRAMVGALVLALPVTGLAVLAGLRMAVATDVLDDPVMLGVATVLVGFALPFLSVWLCRRDNWLNYAALFETAWTIAIRFVVSCLFVGAVWLVVYLSDALLQLVDIALIERLMQRGWVLALVSGLVLGLALAVVYELRETLSPFLVLRLLRLLLPVQLAVVGVFLLSLPVRGLNELFGEFSSAATLMGAAILAMTLISCALERNDAEAVAVRGLRLAARLLAMMVPLLAALSVYAVALRVRQYGWTPDRLLAGCVAVFLLAYGLGYCGSVLVGRGWMGRIRRVNVAMALAVIAVSALWMTPLLNAYRISSVSQVARYEAGRADAFQLPLWEMAHKWGRAGRAGLDRLSDLSGGDSGPASLAARIALVRETRSQFQYTQDLDRHQAPRFAAELADLLVLRPETGDGLTIRDLAGVPVYWLKDWLAGCRRVVPDGRAGCVLVTAAFAPMQSVQAQGILLYSDDQGAVQASYVMRQGDGGIMVREVYDPVQGEWPTLGEEVLIQALDGDFRVAPSGEQALFLGGLALVPGN